MVVLKLVSNADWRDIKNTYFRGVMLSVFVLLKIKKNGRGIC